MLLTVWRLHPNGSAVKPADPTLGGTAPLPARQYCGPYMHANGAGFLLFSPIDIDLSYDPNRTFPWEWEMHGSAYEDAEMEVIRSMPVRHEHARTEHLTRRTKIFLSGDDTEPRDTAQIWTGCIFATPPGWSLLIRSPINREVRTPFRIQEAILESDWHHYDIWVNLEFVRHGEVARLRRDGPPIAHLLPLPTEAYEGWSLSERAIVRDDPEAESIFEQWVDYNWEKFHKNGDGNKDRGTYFRRRRMARGGSPECQRPLGP